MNIEGSCKLCILAPIESARHAFIDCPTISGAWTQYNNLGTVLHNSWRTLIHIGVASWRNIWKTQNTAPQRIATFKATWLATEAFCTFDDKPNWRFIPPQDYLPIRLAARSARATPRQVIPIQSPARDPTPLRGTATEDSSPEMRPPHDQGRRYTQANSNTVNLAEVNHEWSSGEEDEEDAILPDPTTQDRWTAAAANANEILRCILQDLEKRPTTTKQAADTVDLDLQSTFDSIYCSLDGDEGED